MFDIGVPNCSGSNLEDDKVCASRIFFANRYFQISNVSEAAALVYFVLQCIEGHSVIPWSDFWLHRAAF